jgi:P-type Ca2+ transporter type 2C
MTDAAAPQPHAASVAAVASALGTDPLRGLSEEEAADRLARLGPNELESRRSASRAVIALRQFRDPLVLLLVIATAVSFAIGEGVEAAAIGVIVIVNALLGFSQELGAEQAILALQNTLERHAQVIRSGRERRVGAESIAPGDLLVLREGERVAADGRLASSEGLAVDESLLTGESMPAEKSPAPVAADTPLADRSPLVFAGTGVTRGHATAIVTATGPNAEVGQVAQLAERAKPPPTPLELRLRNLTRLMVIAGVLITALLAAVRLAQGASADQAFLLGVSVAVAAVPEGLVATMTIALAIGARRMAARGAIVRRLSAVETLGSATVVVSDKTGTLTENELRLGAVAAAGRHSEREVLEAATLASTAELREEDGELRVAGDPLEAALLLGALERGVPAARLRAEATLVAELPFDAERKRMTAAYAEGDGVRAYMKGAPEVVIGRSRAADPERRRIEALAEDWASAGLRVLAVAARGLDPGTAADAERLESDLELLGLVSFHDPLRGTAAAAVGAARAAGVRVQIVTGDHPATAAAIGRELGLPVGAVSARVTPREKLRLVEALQDEGEVVAVTGDGVNDAPALRRAHVGVAMGRAGTEAAREASDVVLTNDDFSTIVAAIHEGRAITDNVRKFVAFLLSANFGEVLLFAVAVFAGLGVPMTVVQVLVVNVLTDGLPAVALARDRPDPGVMRRPPERGSRLFGTESWIALGLVGAVVGAASVAAFLVGRDHGEGVAQTMAFATVALAELGVVFAVRSPSRAFWKEPANPLLLAAVAGSALLLLAALYLPPLRSALGAVALDAGQLAAVVGLAAVPFLAVEAAKAALRRIVPSWAGFGRQLGQVRSGEAAPFSPAGGGQDEATASIDAPTISSSSAATPGTEASVNNDRDE